MDQYDVIEPSLIRAHFGSKKSVSFSSYLKSHNNNHNNKLEERDQICIFDATKYLSGRLDHHQQPQQFVKEHDIVSPINPRLSSVSSSVETISSYKMRSLQTTPTASSEASWNSQVGLLSNPPGLAGISLTKSLSTNSSGNRKTNAANNSNSNSNAGLKWPRISTKWLNRGRKCPCLCKKSVQVVEKTINLKTIPKMDDLRSSTSSNGSTPLYSPKQSSPNNLGINVPSSTLPIMPRDLKDQNFNRVAENPIEKAGFSNNSNSNNNSNNNSCSNDGSYDDLAMVNKGGVVTSINDFTNIAVTVTETVIGCSNNNGFTFPILENQQVGLKKMFNVITPSHENDDDLIEVFRPGIQSSPMSRRTSYEDENVSDGSSDLFEIESFSTTSSPYRDLIDEVIVPNSSFGNNRTKLGIIGLGYINEGKSNNSVDENDKCYAFREVSIDWSDRGRLSNFSASASELASKAMRREAEPYSDCGDGGGGGSELSRFYNRLG
ncbi:hypothetical protein RND81_14G046900 [Saponaria officinalis]|uniref:Uncharacterized protein n=1 Tax=Saponaria officinalis TaxID=3572 RepID=A0AAW1GIB5_SAPOF